MQAEPEVRAVRVAPAETLAVVAAKAAKAERAPQALAAFSASTSAGMEAPAAKVDTGAPAGPAHWAPAVPEGQAAEEATGAPAEVPA